MGSAVGMLLYALKSLVNLTQSSKMLIQTFRKLRKYAFREKPTSSHTNVYIFIGHM